VILVIDNYDSFVYNLVQYVGEAVGATTGPSRARQPGQLPDARSDASPAVVVRRNDEIELSSIERLDPDGIVVSPGPGTPADAGVSTALFSELDRPTLGVCLGHQALCAANGARVERAPAVVHGKPSTVNHDGTGIFEGVPDPIAVGRYHSLAVPRGALPESLIETARTTDEDSIVIAVRHKERPHVGVQFHPESILTGEPDPEGHAVQESAPARSLAVGKQLVQNFCSWTTT